MTITTKGKNVFAMLKEKGEYDYTVEFTASFGWFKPGVLIPGATDLLGTRLHSKK